MPLDFPDHPSPGDIYTFNGRSWQWSGSSWNVVPVVIGFPGATGFTGATGIGTAGPPGPPGATGSGSDALLNGVAFSIPGVLTTLSSSPDLNVPSNKLLAPTGCIARLRIAPVGSSLIANVNVNGSSYMTLTFLDGVDLITPTPTGNIAASSVVNVSVTQIGSSVPGSDLSITLFK